MVNREYWIKAIENLWKERSIIWLMGVRRAGKTCLSKSLENIEYFDCELPRVRRMLEDPQEFLANIKKGQRIVLDEVHRLSNPSELLKIAADYYPSVKILATGSSTLGASAKFRDTLTGRKRELWITPLISEDLNDFKNKNLKHRFLQGGLPPFFLAKKFPESDFQEWMDAYWAKDIQELFRLERKYSFQKFFELVMAQSGGIFEATSFASPCEVSRVTITNYLKVLESTLVVHVIRPFSSYRSAEIVSAPKVYGFDTGFVCYHRGWYELRAQDMGELWEHFVLNQIQAHLQTREIHYWRDKRGHEIDFIFKKRERSKAPIAIECKWKCSQVDEKNIKVFIRQYPDAELFVVAHDIDTTFSKKCENSKITFINLPNLLKRLKT